MTIWSRRRDVRGPNEGQYRRPAAHAGGPSIYDEPTKARLVRHFVVPGRNSWVGAISSWTTLTHLPPAILCGCDHCSVFR